jgi:ankyrin repeat protein
LIKAGADVHRTGSEGSTALMTASENLQERCVALLMAAGADPKATNAHGMNAMQLALATEQGDRSGEAMANVLSLLQPTATDEEMDQLIQEALR